MNLITVIIIGIVIWLVYSLIQSYRNLEKELKEIRAKCIGVNNASTTAAPATVASTTAGTTAGTTSGTTSGTTAGTTSGTTSGTAPTPSQTAQRVTGTKETAPAKISTFSGAYTPNGDQLYSNDNSTADSSTAGSSTAGSSTADSSSTLYNNDPLVSMRNSLIHGLNSIKNYATI